jgi:hypothetical protein
MRFTFTEIDRVEIEGAAFEVGPIPEGVWRRIRLEGVNARRAATRRALLALGPEAITEDVDAAIVTDTDYSAAMERNMREAVAWGVRGHVIPNGPAFKGAAREFFGRSYPGASDETVSDYSEIHLESGETLFGALYVKVSEKNQLGPREKKVSPPPLETTDGDGTAPTA